MAADATSPGGRPREFDVDEVLARSVDLFWRHGYRHTTTRMLEAELGITQSSLYHAFGSKAELFDRAVARYQDDIDRALLQPLREARNPTAGLTAFFDGLGGWTSTEGRGCLITNLMAEPDADPAVARRVAGHRERVYRALRGAVAKIDPASAPSTVRHRSELLLAATIGISLAARAGAPMPDLRRMIRGVAHEIGSWTP